jgi:hypothetical protein
LRIVLTHLIQVQVIVNVWFSHNIARVLTVLL